MGIESITTLVSSVGFPICCCLGLGWYVKYVTDTHKEEISTITTALNNNTLVLTKLCERMGVDRNEENN